MRRAAASRGVATSRPALQNSDSNRTWFEPGHDFETVRDGRQESAGPFLQTGRALAATINHLFRNGNHSVPLAAPQLPHRS